MLALGLLLTTFSAVVTLVLSWLVGVALVAALLLYHRRRIRMHGDEL